MNKKSLFLVATLVTLLVITGTFWFTKKQALAPVVSEPNRLITDESIQIGSEKYLQHIEVIPGNTDEVWYNIPELDIRIRLNKEFAEDLIYTYKREKSEEGDEWDAAHFSTKELITIDKGCAPLEGHPLGGLTKWGRDVQESAKKNNEYFFSGPNSVQIGDYYYVSTGPQASCWDPKNDEAIQRAKSAEDYRGFGAKYVSEALKTLQIIPQK